MQSNAPVSSVLEKDSSSSQAPTVSLSTVGLDSVSQTEVVVVGAGTAGATMAVRLARQGRKVVLVERDWGEQDRIVGELLQPGGLRALERMGMDSAAKCQEALSVRVDGYAVILPPDEQPPGQNPSPDEVDEHWNKNAEEIILKYPPHDPTSFAEKFGILNVDNKNTLEEEAQDAATGKAPKGRSFHNAKFVQRLRELAVAEPNVTVVIGTVTAMVEDSNGKVIGVDCKVSPPTKEEPQMIALKPEQDYGIEPDKLTRRIHASLTVVADGLWSGLRKKVVKPHETIKASSFVGVLVQHPHMEAPVPHRHYGHVILAQPSPILIYQISPTETRILVDIHGKLPSAATGELKKYLEGVASQLPPVFRQGFLEALERGGIKSMPNRSLTGKMADKDGAVLVGDALNMRHPLTGGGMTVALRDVELLSNLLAEEGVLDKSALAATAEDIKDQENLSKEASAALLRVKSRFMDKRRDHASTINVLADALHLVFSAPEGNATRQQLREACFDYLSLGGAKTAGPMSLLSGLSPVPAVLVMHFFLVALHGVKRILLPFPTPTRIVKMYNVLQVACLIIMPLLKREKTTPLSAWPFRKAVNLVFPWENITL